jgi:hypothetical protein
MFSSPPDVIHHPELNGSIGCARDASPRLFGLKVGQRSSGGENPE